MINTFLLNIKIKTQYYNVDKYVCILNNVLSSRYEITKKTQILSNVMLLKDLKSSKFQPVDKVDVYQLLHLTPIIIRL